MASKLTRRKVVQAKIETVSGTKESLSTSDELFAFDPTINSDIEVPDRNASGTLGQIRRASGLRKGKGSLKIEVAGKGSLGIPLWASTILPAAGFTATNNSYAPTSNAANHKTITYGVYEDGLTKYLSGAVVQKLQFDFEAGKIVYASADLVGIFHSAVDAAYPTLPAIPPNPPKFMGSTFTLGGSTPNVSKCSISIENEISYRESAAVAFGLLHCQIVGRKITITMDPEAEAVAARDIFGQLLGDTELPFNLVLGADDYNTITFNAPKSQITGINEGDRSGKLIHELTISANDSTTGDDSITIAF